MSTLPVVRVEFINIDGSVLGEARIKWHGLYGAGAQTSYMHRMLDGMLRQTIGVGYDERVNLPVGGIGDPRCPYGLRLTLREPGEPYVQ